ncbi:MAG: hypothetical protein PW734_06820 [Verrucomicrobium sp.]|nr:hypothetical protein [Verrucomicrobium sp.]
MKYKIEKGIEISAKRKNVTKYPFLEMEIGDSFVFEKKNYRKVLSSASHSSKTGKRFESRAISENEVRIWRVK